MPLARRNQYQIVTQLSVDMSQQIHDIATADNISKSHVQRKALRAGLDLLETMTYKELRLCLRDQKTFPYRAKYPCKTTMLISPDDLKRIDGVHGKVGVRNKTTVTREALRLGLAAVNTRHADTTQIAA